VAGAQGRLQQRRMEVKEAPSIGRGPLGKDRDVLSPVENRRDLLVDDLRVAAAATAQEHRVVLGGQPADQGPVADLFLGNERRGQRSVDHVDVDPRDVVGDDQRPRRGMAEIGLDLDAEGIEQGHRPTGLQT